MLNSTPSNHHYIRYFTVLMSLSIFHNMSIKYMTISVADDK